MPGGRPRTYHQDRISTGVRFNPETHVRLIKAAEERDLSLNWLVNKAVEYYLDRLIPVDEIKWTRD